MVSHKVLFFSLSFSCFVLLLLMMSLAYAQVARPDLSGVYKSNDNGFYYVRQVGGTVYWLGMSADGGKTFTNVYHGFIQGNFILGTWADVPYGTTHNSGTLNLKITGPNTFSRLAETGGFSGSIWTKK
jgi:hypothetical protein